MTLLGWLGRTKSSFSPFAYFLPNSQHSIFQNLLYLRTQTEMLMFRIKLLSS
jgi:hypothetical protein